MKSGGRMLSAALCCWCVALGADQPFTGHLTTSDVCERIDQQIAALNNIVMREEISRYESVHGRPQKLDEFDALVEINDGYDTVASLRRNGKRYLNPKQIPGAWSFGDFSTILRISREALEKQPLRFLPGSGVEPAALASSFHYSATSARWFVAMGSRTYWLDFLGDIRMSPETGDVFSISWVSAPPPAESDIRQIQRTIRFAPVEVAGETFVLPESAEYRVIHLKDHVEWNTTKFLDPARYGSVSAVQFGN